MPARFLARLRSLYAIERDDVAWMSETQWLGFRTDRARYLCRCDADTARRILAILERRQHDLGTAAIELTATGRAALWNGSKR